MVYLYIFIGGGIGASLRHLISSFLSKPNVEFPFAILAVNILGSLLIGALAGAISKGLVQGGTNTHMLLAIGLLGGFTTFSTFSLETLQLIQTGKYILAASYIAASVILSVGACFIGLILTK